MRAAVVGHVEWVRFAQVERVPEQGEIVTAMDTWEEPAGGGAVAVGELVRLGAEVDFFVAVGNDELGRRARGRSRGARLPRPRGDARRAAAARVHLPRRRRRADDHAHGLEAAPARRRPASVGRAGRRGRRLLHRRRPGCAAGGAAGAALSSRPRASCRRWSWRRCSSTRSSAADATRASRTSPACSIRSRA